MRFFGFAIADSMFPGECVVSRRPLTVDEVRDKLADCQMCVNPSHKPTIDAATKKYGLVIAVPEKAPNIALKSGDSVIVVSMRGLSRLEGRHEYTADEIDKTEKAMKKLLIALYQRLANNAASRRVAAMKAGDWETAWHYWKVDCVATSRANVLYSNYNATHENFPPTDDTAKAEWIAGCQMFQREMAV